ncbi:MAG: hypothetical protein GDA50_07415 [Alphaproteobacteria bacterium GM202ARS2]|nr:hypothetical protein [Alphaproteobacteria bacterium GM202ARS2]
MTDASLLFSAHLPMTQGENPTIAAFLQEGERYSLVSINETDDTDFDRHVMGRIAALVKVISRRTIGDGAALLRSRLIFSGGGANAWSLARRLAPTFKAGDYDVVEITAGGRAACRVHAIPLHGVPKPVSQVPRLIFIGALQDLAAPGQDRIGTELDPKEMEALRAEAVTFEERARKMPTDDPAALMDFQGDGRMVALGIGVWSILYGRESVNAVTPGAEPGNR